MKEKIIAFLEKHPYSEKELSLILESDIHEILDDMKRKGEIIFYKREYYLPKKLKVFRARIVSIKEDYAFAKIEDKEDDVYIDDSDLCGAFLDDEVFIKKIPTHSRKESYEVISIINRSRKNLVGEIRIKKGVFILDVKGISTSNHLFIIKESSFALIPHSLVLARINKTYEDYTIVTPIELLGNSNDPSLDILKIIYAYDAPVKFPLDVLKEVKEVKTSVTLEEEKNRKSFLDHVIVTIDGESAKDFDDAVEVIKDKDCYHVGVHIADVSHYVLLNSSLDKEALLRSTSIYCADKVVPMLPFELSNGICSLNPNVKRLVMSVLFDVDFKGNVFNYSLHKGVIKSSARLTYTYVNRVIKEHIIDDKIDARVNEMIPILNEVASIIRKKREEKGCLDLSSTELVFNIGEDKKIDSVTKRVQDVGEKLIEDLMIQANEVVTLIAKEKNMPFLYRIHENPKIKRLEQFKKLCKVMGIKCDINSFDVTPKELQCLMTEIKDEKIKDVLSSYLLRSLAKARYSYINKGHFGLALENYTHFTSPIRRYPDLMVHRLFDYYLFNTNQNINELEIINELPFISEVTSIRERRAQSIEREVDDLYSLKYMQSFIGEEFLATIVGFSAYGFFVELENGIEGYVPFDILDDYYIYYEDSFMAISKNNKRLKLGDEIKVILKMCILEKKQIVFSLPSYKKNYTIEKKEKKTHGRKHKNTRK